MPEIVRTQSMVILPNCYGNEEVKMKTNFLLVRHAQSEARERGIVQGEGLTVPLSEQGIKQAEKLGDFLRDHNFDQIFSSTALRAIDTAKAIRKFHADIPYIEIKELNERSKGEAEGMLKSEFNTKYPEILKRWEKEEDARPEGGESYGDVEKRVMPIFDKHLKEFSGEKLLYVTHGNLIKVVLGNILEIPYGKRARIEQDYFALNSLAFDQEKGRWSIEYINRTCL